MPLTEREQFHLPYAYRRFFIGRQCNMVNAICNTIFFRDNGIFRQKMCPFALFAIVYRRFVNTVIQYKPGTGILDNNGSKAADDKGQHKKGKHLELANHET